MVFLFEDRLLPCFTCLLVKLVKHHSFSISEFFPVFFGRSEILNPLLSFCGGSEILNPLITVFFGGNSDFLPVFLGG